MTNRDYLKIFNSFLDNDLFNQAIILSTNKISEITKLQILDEIAYRLQVEFGKRVIFITNKECSGDIETFTKKDKTSELPLLYTDKKNTVFVLYLDMPYFEDRLDWEQKVIECLIYYKYPVFGFKSDNQRVKFYDI